MKGQIKIPVGRYEVEPEIWFDIRLTDLGAIVSLCNNHTNVRHSVVIGEDGKLKWSETGELIRQKRPGK